ncbi:MAG: hypothetical protein GY711_25020 [bacterium]|nr:hypothetical protein [bacterium]
MLVGAPKDSETASFAGAMFQFDAVTGAQISKHLTSDGSFLDFFGVSIAMSGDTLVGGAPREVAHPGAPGGLLGGSWGPPGSQGLLCLADTIGRYRADVIDTGASGAAALALDLNATPTPIGPVAIRVGETWNSQLWFRDANPEPTSNFTDGSSVTFR